MPSTHPSTLLSRLRVLAGLGGALLMMASGCRALDGLPSAPSLRSEAHTIRVGQRDEALAAAGRVSSDLRQLAISKWPLRDVDGAARSRILNAELMPALLQRLPAWDDDANYAFGEALYWSVMHLGPEAAVHVAAMGKTLRSPRGGAATGTWHHEHVLRALAQLGPGAVAAVGDIEVVLGSSDDDLVHEAGRTLGAIGGGAVGTLVRHLRSDRAVVRHASVTGLGAVRPFNTSWLPHLARAAQDESEDVTAAAVQALLALSYDGTDMRDVRPVVRKLLTHPSRRIRADAEALLRRMTGS